MTSKYAEGKHKETYIVYILHANYLLAYILLSYWLFVSTYKAHILHDHILYP